jgi:hypothetical protein
MARKRSIDPDLWTDDRVQSLPSPLAILLYIGTLSQADDDGRLEWSARQITARIFPLREDVKQRDVEVAMTAIADGLVHVYTIGGRTFAHHPSWKKHQYVNRPSKSKIPDPPCCGSLNSSVSKSDDDSDTAHVSLSHAVSPHVPLVSDSVSVLDSVSGLASLGTDERAKMSDGMEFGAWLCTAGIAAGAIPKQFEIDPGRVGFAYKFVAKSEALVATHGVEECRRRAENMIARKVRKDGDKLLMPCTPQTLHERWEWFDKADRERAVTGPVAKLYDARDIGGAAAVESIKAVKRVVQV